ncbi:protein FAR1-RELATED SEQUENCE 5-like [Phragmites australis]|uniref:protein FAR1-RELATED SEQUENCE 5-like n=1 Tax=Phragmites australis TaxID=29695 RepID=UPI002D76CDDA|nr:protein FAR1-RELATED SEQUENCE 5-like [Phragmites australis]
MKKAISAVFPETWHGLCTFHIMQNAVKHLARLKSDNDSNILADFSACVYEYDDETTFEEAFSALRSKVQNDAWLGGIYQQKEKWPACYMKNVFTLGMRSTQLSESLNNDMKNYLKCDLDIAQFFTHFERAVASKRAKELDSEYNARKKLPRIKMMAPLLIQASNLYTTCIFEAFQAEYERSMAAYARPTEKPNEYIVGIGALDGKSTMEEEYIVAGDLSNQRVCCSYQQFERIGILCSHALKVLDMMNIKLLPEHYILKRWTREARCGIVQDIHGMAILENPKIDAARRYQLLTRKFFTIASRAVDFEECYSMVDVVLNTLYKQVEDKINDSSNFH